MRNIKLISHRCNTKGVNKSEENHPGRADAVIAEGYDVELDIWISAGELYLGHDLPQYKVSSEWVLDRADKLWLHCKNLAALERMSLLSVVEPLNYFWHQNDDFTLTSKRFVWTYPNRPLISDSILVHPERVGLWDVEVAGICSDYIERYR